MENLNNSELLRRMLQIPLFKEIHNTLREASGAVDWQIASQVASAVAGSGIRNDRPSASDVDGFGQACRIAELSVVGHTGLGPVQGITGVSLLGRTEWAQATLDRLKPLIERLARRLASPGGSDPSMKLAGPLMDAIAPFAMGAQMGLVAGYLSHESLSLWELCLPGKKAGKLLFDFPNIVAVESDLKVPAEQFRMWLALHEVAHEINFQAVTWAGPYLTGLVEQYIDAAEMESARVISRLRALTDSEELGAIMQRPDELFPMLRSPAQESIVERIGCFMSVAEGYGDWVLERAGRGLVDTFDKIREGMNRRRAERSSAEKMLEKMLGLELPGDQHRTGRKFIAAVADAGEMERLWRRPEYLPDTVELAHPARWLSRAATP